MSNNIRTYQNFTPKIGKNCFIDSSAVIIGQVELADDVSIWPTAVLRGDVNSITIGARSNIQDGAVIHVNHKTKEKPLGDPTIIGNEVTIGHQVALHGCTIHNNVLVGIGAKILEEVVIESEVMVGAGSLVSSGKILKSGFLYFGSPARQIRSLTDAEYQLLQESPQGYVDLKNTFLR